MMPIAQWDFGALRLFISWASVPSLYPIGVQLLFMPFGLVNNTGLLPEGVVNMLMVMLLGTVNFIPNSTDEDGLIQGKSTVPERSS